MDHKVFYSVADLVKLGVGSKAKIFKLIKTGALHARKNGGRTVFLPQDLQRYLENLPVAGHRDLA